MDELVELLKSLAKASHNVLKKVERYQKLRAESTANVHSLEKSLGEIRQLAGHLPESQVRTNLTKWTEMETSRIAKLKEDLHFSFGRDLKELMTNQGRSLKGQLPILRCGLWTIKVDFEVGNAVIYWGPEVERVKGKVILKPGDIARAIDDLDEDLRTESMASHELLEATFRAYERTLMMHRGAAGEKVLLVDLLGELVFLIQPSGFRDDPRREKFKEYSRIHFAYDIFLLRRQNSELRVGEQRLRLTVATFDATLDKRRALWIPENEEGEGTYYSYVSFGQQ